MQAWVIIVAALIALLLGFWFYRRQQQSQQAQQLATAVQQQLASGGAAAAAASQPAAPGAPQAAAGAPAAAAAAGVAKQRKVVDVTDQELAAYLQDPSRPCVVLFFSPACSHCKNMMSAYEQYGQVAGPKVHVLRIDCSRFSNVAEQHRIDGFPTIKLFQNGQATKEYQGDRRVGSFMVFQSGN